MRKKNTIRLNESMLHRIIKESVKSVLREGIENEYRIIAYLIDPSSEWMNNVDDDKAVEDYAFISDETNDFKERVKRLKKYRVKGDGSEYYFCDDEYIIDEDADGIYLLQLQPRY